MIIKHVIDRAFAVAGAVLFAQFPQFFGQYLHQLSGRAHELSYQVSMMENSAKLSHKTLPELIFKFTHHTDGDITRQGELMQYTLERLNALSYAETTLSHATILAKPLLFIRYLDLSIARDTFQHFQWGFSFSVEGLAYACIGLCFGFGCFQLVNFLMSYFPRALWRLGK